jgi:hypothetical protein
MGKGKGAGSSKAAVKGAQDDIRQDASVADIRSLYADITPQYQSDITPITPINDSRKHPDSTLSAAVASMSFAGFDARRICSALRISPNTLHGHYQDEFENGCSRMVDKIAGSLAQRALAGSDTAAIFLLKTRGHGKFVERQQVDMNVEVTHKAELVTQLAGLISQGITIDAEPVEQKKEGP